MAELVERPPPGDLFEDSGSPFVGQPSPAGVWAFVSPSRYDVGLPVCEEHRSSVSPGQVPGEKARCS